MVPVLFRFPLDGSRISPDCGLGQSTDSTQASFDVPLPMTHLGRSILLGKFGTNAPFYFCSKLATIVRVDGRTNDICCHDTAETQRFENI